MGLLTDSQILAIKYDLFKMLSMFETQAQALKSSPFVKDIPQGFTNFYFTGGWKLVLDLDNWETSDEGEENNGNAPCTCLVPSDPEMSVSQGL